MLLFLSFIFLTLARNERNSPLGEDGEVFQAKPEFRLQRQQLGACSPSAVSTNLTTSNFGSWVRPLLIVSPVYIASSLTVSAITFQNGFTRSYQGLFTVDLVIYAADSNQNPTTLLAVSKGVNMSNYATGSVWNCVALTSPMSISVSAGSSLWVGFFLSSGSGYPAYGIQKVYASGQRDIYSLSATSIPNVFPTYSTESNMVLIVGVSSASCPALSTCSACVPNSGCAWCLTSQTCIANSQTPSCPSFTHSPSFCNQCLSLTNCQTCASSSTCAWCEQPSGSSCVRIRDDSKCTTAITDPKYCNTH